MAFENNYTGSLGISRFKYSYKLYYEIIVHVWILISEKYLLFLCRGGQLYLCVESDFRVDCVPINLLATIIYYCACLMMRGQKT